jgi:fatty-acyl-CoA synthase
MELVTRIQALIRQDLGIDCFIELVPRNTLPRTTSGKLSRSGAKNDFLQRVKDGEAEQPGASEDEYILRRKAG